MNYKHLQNKQKLIISTKHGININFEVNFKITSEFHEDTDKKDSKYLS